jgi:hypothetical protein
MNERIKELAEQANSQHDNFFDLNYKELDVFLEKFAELLIKECSKVIETWKKEPFPFDEDLAVQLIHEHFGFEVPPKTIKVIKI